MEPTSQEIEAILALQVLIAWAGEAECEPKRLGWWRTDLTDPDGGGYLLKKLLPRTHRWAALQAVRMAAIRTDSEARSRMADPDRVKTLFHWGFRIDEKLDERLRELKASSHLPLESLPFAIAPEGELNRDTLVRYLESFDPVEVDIAAGRCLQRVPHKIRDRARALARALLPLKDDYPLPYFRESEVEVRESEARESKVEETTR